MILWEDNMRIKVRTRGNEELNTTLQEIAFAEGYGWGGGNVQRIMYKTAHYLVFDTSYKTIKFGDTEEDYLDSEAIPLEN